MAFVRENPSVEPFNHAPLKLPNLQVSRNLLIHRVFSIWTLYAR